MQSFFNYFKLLSLKSPFYYEFRVQLTAHYIWNYWKSNLNNKLLNWTKNLH